MKRPTVTEQQIAEVVVAYLEALGADVYQEVTIAGGVADIVARVRAEVWIVEVKTSLSLALLTQAMERRRLAHRVVIAAPYTRNMREVSTLCEAIGIGLWDVRLGAPDLQRADIAADHHGYGWPHVREVISPRRWNTRPVALAAELKPEHKTHAKAGAVGAGGRWTPFRATCEEVARIVRAQPGITVKACIEQAKHHYRSNRSAISSIAHWVERGKVEGVRIERGDALRLFPVERRGGA